MPPRSETGKVALSSIGSRGGKAALAASRAPAAVAPRRAPLVAFAVLAALASFATMHEHLVATWRDGAFVDTDDTMHIVQVRALLAGQNWFDMTVPGMNPPVGTPMHWSRMVDLPLAALIKLFGLAVDAVTAERLTRLAFPFLLLVGLYLAIARLAGLLTGRDARLPAMLATLISGAAVNEFMPGRVDHHAPQILILVAMLGCAVAALDARRAGQAVLVGVLSALSLSINLENLPFIAVLGGWFLVLWVWRGAMMRRALGAYAGGLALGLPAFFAATVAPKLYAAPVCDAFGAAHLGAGLVAAAGCGCAALAGTRPRTVAVRGAAVVALGATMLGFVALLYPSCLHGPFAGVDPLVRELWLSRVDESLPFMTLFRLEPSEALCAMVPVLLGFCACLAATRRLAPQRAGFGLLAAIVGTGLLLTFWQVRVFATITAIACCGGVDAVVAVRRRWQGPRPTLASLSLALLFPFTATAVALVVPAGAAPSPTADRHGATPGACLAPAAFRPLARLKGAVIAPVDIGSFLLVHTDLTVFAAAFHRNNDGNRFMLDTMLASPEAAAALAARRGAAFLLVCDDLLETRNLAARAPGSLAAAVLGGREPAWLERVALAPTPLRLYRVTPAPH